MALFARDPNLPKPEVIDTHIPGHFFQGVCICPCGSCTTRKTPGSDPICICLDCPSQNCGLKAPAAS